MNIDYGLTIQELYNARRNNIHFDAEVKTRALQLIMNFDVVSHEVRRQCYQQAALEVARSIK